MDKIYLIVRNGIVERWCRTKQMARFLQDIDGTIETMEVPDHLGCPMSGLHEHDYVKGRPPMKSGEGMLWWDQGHSRFEHALQAALDYYTSKYGHEPDVCHVNPVDYTEEQVLGVKIVKDKLIQPHHMWLRKEVIND